MFGIGETELVIIVLFAFMVFGPDKLPGIGRTIGRALRQFREAQQGFTQVVQTEVLDPAAEAMNVTPTRRTRNRAAELEADSDIEDGTEDTPRRKETFAERRARLEAERKAAAEAEAAAAAEAEAAAAEAETELVEDDEDTDIEAGATQTAEAPEVAVKPEPEPEPEPEVEDDPLASLYGISSKTTKSARKQASEEKAAAVAARKAEAEAKAAAEAEAAAAAAEDEPASEDEDEPASEDDAAPAADADETGKEDGTTEA